MPPSSARSPGRAGGLTLVELLVALVLTAFLVLGLVQMVSAATAADALQRNQAQLLDRARFALNTLGRAVREAGFRPEPWNDAFAIEALTEDTLDDASARGDRLAVRSWSDRNCFDNRNPDTDGAGRPLFYLRESTFEPLASGGLAHRCRYGPDPASLTTQIARQGLVEGVESLQVLYGEDADGDGNAETWVRAGQWTASGRVLGIRIALLVAGDDAVAEAGPADLSILDESRRTPADGRLRHVFESAFAIRGKT
jgi:type IV pilus assembly protein PilW